MSTSDDAGPVTPGSSAPVPPPDRDGSALPPSDRTLLEDAGEDGAGPEKPNVRRVVAWSLWDLAASAFNAVITTFVFTRWLTSEAFVDSGKLGAARATLQAATDALAKAQADGLTGADLTQYTQARNAANAAVEVLTAQPSAWLGWGLAIAGLAIALLAPVTGARSDDTGRRKLWLGVYTGLSVLACAFMVFIVPDQDNLTFNLVLGIFLLSIGNIFYELAAVNYNAMLPQISTPGTMGKVSGIGWGSGYVGGIILLAILLFAFIQPDVGLFGVTAENGMDIRAAVLFATIWYAVFSIPVLVAVPEVPRNEKRAKIGFFASYVQLFRDVQAIWRQDRHMIYFMLSSAVFRDGLAGVFTFGAVIAAGTFGFTATDVVYFAVAANLVAGVVTFAAGALDDRIGPKRVIVLALSFILVAGFAVFFLHGSGTWVFWVFGLCLSAFVGPAQSASRSLLGRLIPKGRESEMFGLYATTGRAASFMAPAAWAAFISLGGAQYWGILGIMLIIGVGLGLLIPVKVRSHLAAATS